MKGVFMIGCMGRYRVWIMIYAGEHLRAFLAIEMGLFYPGRFSSCTAEEIEHEQRIVRTGFDIVYFLF